MIVDGDVKDIKYKRDKRLDFPFYVVYLGDKVIAQLFGSTRHRHWSVIVVGDTPYLRRVEGFTNRDRAVIYALTALGYYKD